MGDVFSADGTLGSIVINAALAVGAGDENRVIEFLVVAGIVTRDVPLIAVPIIHGDQLFLIGGPSFKESRLDQSEAGKQWMFESIDFTGDDLLILQTAIRE